MTKQQKRQPPQPKPYEGLPNEWWISEYNAALFLGITLTQWKALRVKPRKAPPPDAQPRPPEIPMPVMSCDGSRMYELGDMRQYRLDLIEHLKAIGTPGKWVIDKPKKPKPKPKGGDE